jgi:hypothetical protein
MKKSKIVISVLLGALVTVSAIGVFGGSFVSAAEAGVDEIVADPAAFDNQAVITEGIVREWEIKEYTITVTGEGVNDTHTVLRYYLVVEDPDTTDMIRVRLNYRGKSPDLTLDSFTIGETLLIEGIVKDFKFETEEEDLDVDLVILAKEIVRENGDVIVILTDADVEAFQERRLERKERRNTFMNQVQTGSAENQIEEISAEVLQWDIKELNITVQGEGRYETKNVTRALLLVRNVDTDATILVKLNLRRVNFTVAESFIAVGDIITIKGIVRDGELNTEILDSEVEVDAMMVAFSITNADGVEHVLISRDAYMQAREQGHYRFKTSEKNKGLGDRRIVPPMTNR